MNLFRRKGPPSRLRRRLIFALIFGVVLALPLIWFSSAVHDPFAGTVFDLRALVPADVDFYVEIPDLPGFFKGLEAGAFYSDLDRHRGFQSLLSHPELRKTGIIDRLETILELSTDKGVELPLNLQPIGDISGTQVLVAGYAPTNPGALPRVLAVFKPESWIVCAAVNVLVQGTLSNTVDERLAEQGITIDRQNNLAVLRFTGTNAPPPLACALIRDTVLVSTDIAAAERILNAAGTPRIPNRFRQEGRWLSSTATTVNFLCRRTVAEKHLGFRDQVVAPRIGHRSAATLERYFPEQTGEDIVGWASFEESLNIAFQVDSLPRSRTDPFTRSEEIDTGRVREEFEKVLSIFPHYLFAYAHQNVGPDWIIEFALNEPEIVPFDRRKLWLESIGEYLPRFKGSVGGAVSGQEIVNQLQSELRQCFSPGVGVAIFIQKRDEKIPKSNPGLAAIFRIRDRAHLLRLIDEVDQVRRDVRSFERYEDPEMIRWQVTAKGLVDDASVSQPGFAIIGDYFIFTNWFRMLDDMLAVARRQASGSESMEQIRELIDDLDAGSRFLAFVDEHQVFDYCDSAKAGWIAARTEISEISKFSKRQEIARRADAERIPPERREAWMEAEWRAWLNGVTQDRNPARIEAEIDQQLNWFRGAFRDSVLIFGEDDGRFKVHWRLTTRTFSDG